MGKRGQVTIFIILALVIVGLAGAYFLVKDSINTEKVSPEFSPVENSFLSCVEGHVKTGISILESQGGRIYLPDFVPGSRYMPFSSQLNFLGVEIPYWHYKTGNNLDVEQVPEIKDMEDDLERYLEENIPKCSFYDYVPQGYDISLNVKNVDVGIKDGAVDVEVDAPLSISKEGESSVITKHTIEVNSQLKSLYDDAREVYNAEENTFFLENYSLDVLRNYLPVDGVELRCAPMTWDLFSLYGNFSNALAENIMSLKNKGGKNDYFALNLPVDSELRFMTGPSWPNTFEVDPADSNILTAEPIGNQEGLGILGFCYVPYHFVYNVRYPVLIQLRKGDEVFQFPVAVLIEGNLPRNAREGNPSAGEEVPNLCENANTWLNVSLEDKNGAPVEGKVKFDCLTSSCDLGSTNKGKVDGMVPQCVNGNLIIQAPGYERYSLIYDSLNDGSLSVVLDKLYDLPVTILADEKPYSGNAIITLVSDDRTKTVLYPSYRRVNISKGSYEIKVQLYGDSNLKLPSTTREECHTVPRAGVIGAFGLTKKECVEVKVPEQVVTNALIGGGTGDYYFGEGELAGANSLVLHVDKFKSPESLEDVQDNYDLFNVSVLEVEVK